MSSPKPPIPRKPVLSERQRSVILARYSQQPDGDDDGGTLKPPQDDRGETLKSPHEPPGSLIGDRSEDESEESEDSDESDSDDDTASVATSVVSKQTDAAMLDRMDKDEKKVYYIAREIMTSEKVFVDVLRLIHVDFRQFLQERRKGSKMTILPEQEYKGLFSNLPELLMLNEDLLRDFKERIENWDALKKIADIVKKKGPYLQLYKVYITDFKTIDKQFDECCQKYPEFDKLVKEFESLPKCKNLKIKHFMLKPIQRLPQYKLLFNDYLKHLDVESIDYDDTVAALKIVSDAADIANKVLHDSVRFFNWFVKI